MIPEKRRSKECEKSDSKDEEKRLHLGSINALQCSLLWTNQTKPGMHHDVGDAVLRVCVSSANQQNLESQSRSEIMQGSAAPIAGEDSTRRCKQPAAQPPIRQNLNVGTVGSPYRPGD